MTLLRFFQAFLHKVEEITSGAIQDKKMYLMKNTGEKSF